jgi:hypothetical protein
MKLTGIFVALLFAGLAGFSAASVAAQQPQGAALGIVVTAQNALVGNAPLSDGATIYTGDYLSTTDGGTLLVRLGALSLELQASSAAHIYRAPYGAIVELNRGSVVYTTPGTHDNIVIVANDVRVTPNFTQPDLGRVTIDDPCNVTVFSQRGQSTVQSGSESHTVEEGKAYRVRGDNEVSYHKYISPDENDYHDFHGHKPCAPVEMVKGHAPIAPGQSHFLLVVGVIAGTATGIGIWKAFESPARP